ncbi:MAG: hypothetical protein AABY32_00495 [Nanoarchaeota archaeon]
MKKRQKNKVRLATIFFIFLLILFSIILCVKIFQKNGETTGEIRYCNSDSSYIDVCAEIYEPVCGYYTLEECDNINCRKTLSNSCFACIDKNVLFYIDGGC